MIVKRRMVSLSAYHYFQDVGLWPLAKDLNYEQWLNNFDEGEDQELAKRILDFFVYIPDNHVNQMLQTVIGKCGYYFKERIASWNNDSFLNDCWYSFIPGEKRSFTDSGYIFTRKLRDEVGIPDNHILGYDQLMASIIQCAPIKNIILVDDFVGSGAQCDTAWNRHQLGTTGITLSYLAQIKKLNVVYAPLIVNEMGQQRIESQCQGLKLVFIHLLKEEYSLFNENGLCWNGDHDLYCRWCCLFKKICQREGIPLTGGVSVIDGKGFGEQGLAIAFSHGIPDACSALFYWNSDTWKPLIKKHYQHGSKR